MYRIILPRVGVAYLGFWLPLLYLESDRTNKLSLVLFYLDRVKVLDVGIAGTERQDTDTESGGNTASIRIFSFAATITLRHPELCQPIF